MYTVIKQNDGQTIQKMKKKFKVLSNTSKVADKQMKRLKFITTVMKVHVL